VFSELPSLLVWAAENMSLIQNITTDLHSPLSVTVSSPGNIFLHNEFLLRKTQLWRNGVTGTGLTVFSGAYCMNPFIDINGDLYCIRYVVGIIVKIFMSTKNYHAKNIAGTGSSGSGPTELNEPRGIFVDESLNLYVADTLNHRVQLFRPGQANGTTVVGTGGQYSIALNTPFAILLDADSNLFILEKNLHRVIRVGKNEIRCIIGCTGSAGSAANELSSPRSLSFDPFGNLYVSDTGNQRL
jgi:hypothetical protein